MSDPQQILADPDYIFSRSDPSDPYLYGYFEGFPAVVYTTFSSGLTNWESQKEENRDSSSTKIYLGNEQKENVLVDRIESLSQLEDNWDTEGAEAPTQQVLWNSKIVLEILFHLELFPSDVVPSVEGGVGIVFKHGESYVDIELFNDGDIVITMSRKDGNPSVFEVENITPQEIERVRRFLYSRST